MSAEGHADAETPRGVPRQGVFGLGPLPEPPPRIARERVLPNLLSEPPVVGAAMSFGTPQALPSLLRQEPSLMGTPSVRLVWSPTLRREETKEEAEAAKEKVLGAWKEAAATGERDLVTTFLAFLNKQAAAIRDGRSAASREALSEVIDDALRKSNLDLRELFARVSNKLDNNADPRSCGEMVLVEAPPMLDRDHPRVGELFLHLMALMSRHGPKLGAGWGFALCLQGADSLRLVVGDDQGGRIHQPHRTRARSASQIRSAPSPAVNNPSAAALPPPRRRPRAGAVAPNVVDVIHSCESYASYPLHFLILMAKYAAEDVRVHMIALLRKVVSFMNGACAEAAEQLDASATAVDAGHAAKVAGYAVEAELEVCGAQKREAVAQVVHASKQIVAAAKQLATSGDRWRWVSGGPRQGPSYFVSDVFRDPRELASLVPDNEHVRQLNLLMQHMGARSRGDDDATAGSGPCFAANAGRRDADAFLHRICVKCGRWETGDFDPYKLRPGDTWQQCVDAGTPGDPRTRNHEYRAVLQCRPLLLVARLVLPEAMKAMLGTWSIDRRHTGTFVRRGKDCEIFTDIWDACGRPDLAAEAETPAARPASSASPAPPWSGADPVGAEWWASAPVVHFLLRCLRGRHEVYEVQCVKQTRPPISVRPHAKFWPSGYSPGSHESRREFYHRSGVGPFADYYDTLRRKDEAVLKMVRYLIRAGGAMREVYVGGQVDTDDAERHIDVRLRRVPRSALDSLCAGGRGDVDAVWYVNHFYDRCGMFEWSGGVLGLSLLLQHAPEDLGTVFDAQYLQHLPCPLAHLNQYMSDPHGASVLVQYRHLWRATRLGQEVLVYDTGLSFLHWLCLAGDARITKWFLRLYERTVLEGSVGKVKRRLFLEPLLCKTSRLGWTPIHYAVYSNAYESIEGIFRTVKRMFGALVLKTLTNEAAPGAGGDFRAYIEDELRTRVSINSAADPNTIPIGGAAVEVAQRARAGGSAEAPGRWSATAAKNAQDVRDASAASFSGGAGGYTGLVETSDRAADVAMWTEGMWDVQHQELAAPHTPTGGASGPTSPGRVGSATQASRMQIRGEHCMAGVGPIHLAVMFAHSRCVLDLLEAGADPLATIDAENVDAHDVAIVLRYRLYVDAQLPQARAEGGEDQRNKDMEKVLVANVAQLNEHRMVRAKLRRAGFKGLFRNLLPHVLALVMALLLAFTYYRALGTEDYLYLAASSVTDRLAREEFVHEFGVSLQSLNDVADLGEFYTWLGTRFSAELFPPGPITPLLQHWAVIGSIRMSEFRGTSQACPAPTWWDPQWATWANGGASGTGNQCYDNIVEVRDPGREEDELAFLTYDSPYTGVLWNLLPPEGPPTVDGAVNTTDIPSDPAAGRAMLQDMVNAQRFDVHTRAVALWVLLYNPSTDTFVCVTILMEMTVEGMVHPSMTVSSVPGPLLTAETGGAAFHLFPIPLVYLLFYTFYFVVEEVQDFIHTDPHLRPSKRGLRVNTGPRPTPVPSPPSPGTATCNHTPLATSLRGASPHDKGAVAKRGARAVSFSSRPPHLDTPLLWAGLSESGSPTSSPDAVRQGEKKAAGPGCRGRAFDVLMSVVGTVRRVLYKFFNYLRVDWNLVDFLGLIILIVMITTHVIVYVMIQRVRADFEAHPPYTAGVVEQTWFYAAFFRLRAWLVIQLCLLAAVLMLQMWKLLKYSKLTPHIGPYIIALGHAVSCKDLMGFIIIWQVIILAFTLSLHLILKEYLPEHRSLRDSFFTVQQHVLSSFEAFGGYYQTHSRLGPVLWLVLTYVCHLLLLNLFIAVTSKGYERGLLHAHRDWGLAVIEAHHVRKLGLLGRFGITVNDVGRTFGQWFNVKPLLRRGVSLEAFAERRQKWVDAYDRGDLVNMTTHAYAREWEVVRQHVLEEDLEWMEESEGTAFQPLRLSETHSNVEW